MCEVKKCSKCKKEYPIYHFTNIYGKEFRMCSKCRAYYKNRDKITGRYKTDEYRAWKRELYKTDKVQQQVKAYRQREYVKESRRLYYHREDVKERVKLRNEEKYLTLPDSAIKGQLKAKGFLPEEITEDLIQLQRAEVMLKRKVWKAQKEQGIHYTQKQTKSKTE